MDKLLGKKDHDKYCLIDVIFEVPGLSEFSMAEIYREYKNRRICINGKVKPCIFSDHYMKEHTPVIVYEADDYLRMYNNWTICDKLQIQDYYMKYTYCELYNGNIFPITSSMLFGSIYSIIIMIGRVLQSYKKESKMPINLVIKANEKIYYSKQRQSMNTINVITEKYFLVNNKEYNIDYCFNNINNIEIYKFANRILGLFISENPKSEIPFLSVMQDESDKLFKALMIYENYLIIDD